jgi:hypothetical protein
MMGTTVQRANLNRARFMQRGASSAGWANEKRRLGYLMSCICKVPLLAISLAGVKAIGFVAYRICMRSLRARVIESCVDSCAQGSPRRREDNDFRSSIVVVLIFMPPKKICLRDLRLSCMIWSSLFAVSYCSTSHL